MCFLGITRHFPIVLKENTQRSLHRCLAENMDLFHPLLWPERLARGLFKSRPPRETEVVLRIWRQYLLITTRPTQPRLSRTLSSWILLCLEVSLGGEMRSPAQKVSRGSEISHTVCEISHRVCVCVLVVILCQTSAHSKFGVTPNAQRIEMIGARPEISMSTGARNRL